MARKACQSVSAAPSACACRSPYSGARYRTWLSATIDPGQTPADHAEDGLDAAKVAAMTACGVNLLGLDQFDPNDGRVEASLWSWAPGEPRRENGDCTVMRADGRWYAAPCDDSRPQAPAPRTGEENAALRAATPAGTEIQLTLPAL